MILLNQYIDHAIELHIHICIGYYRHTLLYCTVYWLTVSLMVVSQYSYQFIVFSLYTTIIEERDVVVCETSWWWEWITLIDKDITSYPMTWWWQWPTVTDMNKTCHCHWWIRLWEIRIKFTLMYLSFSYQSIHLLLTLSCISKNSRACIAVILYSNCE